jgi:hypothetical protein
MDTKPMWNNAIYPTSLIKELQRLMSEYGIEPVVQAAVFVTGILPEKREN